MEQKQGEEKIKIIKDEKDHTKKYILKKNRLTIFAIAIIIITLIVIVIALIFSGDLFITIT